MVKTEGEKTAMLRAGGKSAPMNVGKAVRSQDAGGAPRMTKVMSGPKQMRKSTGM